MLNQLHLLLLDLVLYGNRRLYKHRRCWLKLVMLHSVITMIYVVGLRLWLVKCGLIVTMHILVLYIPAICWRMLDGKLATHSRSRLLLVYLLILTTIWDISKRIFRIEDLLCKSLGSSKRLLSISIRRIGIHN